VNRQPRLPGAARWLLRLTPVPRDKRAEVQADLHELFLGRRRDRGAVHAHWRLYHDVASLWRQSRPVVSTATPRSTLALLRDVRGDLRYAVRLFARQPAILLLTIVGLSLGLGIATAAFSIMNAALRGEGVVDPNRVPGVLRTTDRSVSTAWTYDEFLRLRNGSTRMQVEAVLTDAALVRTTAAETDAPSAGLAFVSGGFFAATGGRVTLGRPLVATDEQHMGSPPVVVSFVFWTSRLNQDPAVVGRTIRIGRTAATVVGVADRGFSVPSNRLLWMPLTAYGLVYDSAPVTRTPDMGVQVFGRLLPDVALPEAEAQLSAIAAALPGGATGVDSALRVRLDPHAGLGRVSSSDVLAITLLVSAVIGLVLLLASANVATVLISTAISREREMGVRAALGASRWRIVRQLLTESLALGAIAATIGLVFAYWAIPIIGTMIEAPAGADLAPDLNVYLFLGIVTLVTGVCAGLAPARHSREADLVTPLKGEGARQNRVAPRRLRSMLVMTQAAVSVLLIVMAALFVRATFRAATIDVGFDGDGLYAVSAGLGEALDKDGVRIKNFWARAISELQAVPGIAAVTLAELTPFGGVTKTAITREQPARVVHFNRTRAEYFATLGVRLLAGRTYTREEVAAKAPVALVSQSLARAYWHDQSPLGQLLPQEIPVFETRPVVIGVVTDVITANLHDRNQFAFYEPLDPGSEVFARLMVRMAPGTTGVIEQASQRLRSIDPQADVEITSVAALLQQEAGRPRMLAALTGFVGIIAIVLCVIGLYGLTASVVGQRAREMGVRVAMGAAPRDLLRLLMWDSLRPVVLGLAVGAAAAVLASRVVEAAMFFGVSPQDPFAFAGAAAILLAAAALAVLAPTRRAAAVDAAFVLRSIR
jgi:putative ABC transport system permease protein